MLEISLITVIYKRIGNFGILHNVNATAVNGDIFNNNLQGGIFAFAHLFLQIWDHHIPQKVFCGWYFLRKRYKANKGLKKQVCSSLGVKPIIHQSELRTYTKVVPFKENSSFRFVVLWQILNGM